MATPANNTPSGVTATGLPADLPRSLAETGEQTFELDGAARRGPAQTVLSETGKNRGPLRERRSILRGLTAAPLASLLGFAVCQVAEPDPTFALIEAHRVAWDHFGAMVGEWSDKLGDPPPDVEAKRDAASSAEDDALEALLTPEPTTLAGMRALTDHMLDYAGKMNGPNYAELL